MKYDVTIVGAGPAGSTTAKYLSEKGFKVLLLDKEQFPRQKPCGGGLPIRVLQRYPYIKNKTIIEAYSYGGTAFSPSLHYRVESRKKTPLIATTLRNKFDHELVKIAQDAGTTFQKGKKVVTVKISEENAQVKTKDSTTIDTEIIVGTDGVNSTIAQVTGLRKIGTERGICLVQEFEVDEKILDNYYTSSRHCYVHSRFKTVTGYGWIFPKKHHLNIGFGTIQAYNKTPEPKHNLLAYYHEYIAFLKQKNLIPPILIETPIRGGALPTQPLEKTYGNRVLLVGDAAGFINPLSGEGIYYAMRSGEIAAEIITKGVEKKQINETFLSRYETCWKKDFGKEIMLISKLLKKGDIESRENVFRIASTDTILTDLMLGVITGELGIQKYKWKIVRRFLYASIKNRFQRQKKEIQSEVL